MRISDVGSDVCSSDLAAQVAGAGERILEFTVDYAKERVQFGVTIGQYQAVQYLCTDLVLHYRHTSLFALHAASREGDADLDRKSTRLHSSHYCASRMPSSASNKQIPITEQNTTI